MTGCLRFGPSIDPRLQFAVERHLVLEGMCRQTRQDAGDGKSPEYSGSHEDLKRPSHSLIYSVCEMKLTQRTCLIAVLLLFAAPCLAQESNLYSFEITSVRDGNTLDAQWRPTPKGFDFYEHTPKLDLAGIWSEPTREPPGAYERRVAFMKSLVGRTVQASTRTVAYASRQPDTGTYYLHLYIVHPTEVWLDDKSSLNELLLADGYAMLDEGTSSPLTSLELSRLRAAETGARQAHKGIWGEPTDLYASEKARMLRERELF